MNSREPWVEQVDFRPKDCVKSKQETPQVSVRNMNHVVRSVRPTKRLPSLDQITARLSSHRQVTSPHPVLEGAPRSSPRLPAFLLQDSPAPSRAPTPPPKDTPVPQSRSTLLTGVGRLQIPVRPMPISAPKPVKAEHLRIFPPGSPCSPLTPDLQVTTTLVPRTSTMSPTELSESNLLALNCRARTARDMLSTLGRRTLPSEHGMTGHDKEEGDEYKWRRNSAPANLPQRGRSGFEHPVLCMPGGF